MSRAKMTTQVRETISYHDFKLPCLFMWKIIWSSESRTRTVLCFNQYTNGANLVPRPVPSQGQAPRSKIMICNPDLNRHSGCGSPNVAPDGTRYITQVHTTTQRDLQVRVMGGSNRSRRAQLELYVMIEPKSTLIRSE